ncbi:hypothetical protein E6P07_03915 [Thermochromatium tepidum ATCC 43061]|uniref:Methyl-accepting transducer domain-containing protein n=1 Tax=Thermochromatium tepidum ATCC 43061 TaxID=316276 RepID=A0A6I6EFT8_THETI|nr:hypothetical protein E6P07_03915 [Thermochromatium tepidum ATCC 43061]
MSRSAPRTRWPRPVCRSRCWRSVVTSFQRVSGLVGEIAQLSGKQNADVEEVVRALAALDAITQQNAALVEQSAAADESLEQQAVELEAVVGQFRLRNA